jgi:hypothetical protein
MQKDIFNPIPKSIANVHQMRRDRFLQAALQGFCANPAYSQVSPGTIASLVIDQVESLFDEMDAEPIADEPLIDDNTQSFPEFLA